jgi:hypothetical protein
MKVIRIETLRCDAGWRMFSCTRAAEAPGISL